MECGNGLLSNRQLQSPDGAPFALMYVCVYVCVFVRCCLATKTLYLNNMK